MTAWNVFYKKFTETWKKKKYTETDMAIIMDKLDCN